MQASEMTTYLSMLCSKMVSDRVQETVVCPLCETKPPLALVKLFKLLDRHPDLLDELRAA